MNAPTRGPRYETIPRVIEKVLCLAYAPTMHQQVGVILCFIPSCYNQMHEAIEYSSPNRRKERQEENIVESEVLHREMIEAGIDENEEILTAYVFLSRIFEELYEIEENDSINIICNFVGSQEIGCAHKSSEGRGSSSTL